MAPDLQCATRGIFACHARDACMPFALQRLERIEGQVLTCHDGVVYMQCIHCLQWHARTALSLVPLLPAPHAPLPIWVGELSAHATTQSCVCSAAGAIAYVRCASTRGRATQPHPLHVCLKLVRRVPSLHSTCTLMECRQHTSHQATHGPMAPGQLRSGRPPRCAHCVPKT